MKADVIVVGAGPSGTMAAYELASAGIDVLILEKQVLPRYKTCGGGVTIRGESYLPFAFDPVKEQTIYNMFLTYNGRPWIDLHSEQPLFHTVMRSRFDRFLADKACEAGARLMTGISVQSLTQATSSVHLSTNKETIEAKMVIGADGANSFIASQIGLNKRAFTFLAMENEVEADASLLEKWRTGVAIDFLYVRSGYGWIFPKEDHLSIGVISLLKEKEKLKKYNSLYLQNLEIPPNSITKFSGHHLPFRKPGTPVQRDRVLLAGDAAGYVDAVTGEGISHAIASGRLAGKSAAEYLHGKTTNIMKYSEDFERALTPRISATGKYAGIHAKLPHAVNKILIPLAAKNPMFWKTFCSLVRGERDYPQPGQLLSDLFRSSSIHS